MTTWDVLYVESLEVQTGWSDADVLRELRRGRLTPEDCVRRTGAGQWVRIAEAPEFRTALAAPPAVLRAEPVRQPQLTPGAAARPVAVMTAQAPPSDGPGDDTFQFPERRKSEAEDIDMAPVAQLAWLLILFFVVASTITLQKCIQFPKPSDPEAQAPIPPDPDQEEKENILVDIRHDNSIYVDHEKTPVTSLVERLKRQKRDRMIDTVMIKADGNSYHETVVAAMDAASLANIANIKMAATKRRTAKDASGKAKPKRS